MKSGKSIKFVKEMLPLVNSQKWKKFLYILFISSKLKTHFLKKIVVKCAKVNPLFIEKQTKARLIQAKSKLSWAVDYRSEVIFSDESKLGVCIGDYRKRVFHTKETVFQKDGSKHIVEFLIEVMVWGCMSTLNFFIILCCKISTNIVHRADKCWPKIKLFSRTRRPAIQRNPQKTIG